MTMISTLAQIADTARISDGVEIGPFCIVGPDVTIGAGTVLESHVVITGRVEIGTENRIAPHCYVGADTRGPASSLPHAVTKLGDRNVLFPRVTICGRTSIGDGNQFFDNTTIGRAPQDAGYRGGPTGVEIGNDNVFRENVTVHRGAEKEDGLTRIGHRNYLMENSHVAHNCWVHSNVMMANNVALAGHVQVFDRAIIGGNAAVHQFSTVGTLAFIAGLARVTTDAPPYMMYAGTDKIVIPTVNLVGLRRNGVSEPTIALLRKAHRLLFREHKKLAFVREYFGTELNTVFPMELATLLNAIDFQQAGASGRGREAIRNSPAFHYAPPEEQRHAA